ncbi:MAG: MAPEG family protein [Hyphomicrobiaceae bacterium]|nr:MAPEG family protein [Hyphomicrobiaceae bacterium]
MVVWLLIGIVLYYVQVFAPAIVRFLKMGTMEYLGSRDQEPDLGPVGGRLQRALRNMQENFPVFLALGVAALAVDGANMGQAVLGAQIFVVSRAAYPILYAMAVPAIRSLAAAGGWIGLVLMALALI